MFRRLFSGKGSGLKDFSSVGVDMHSHLVPGIDDGAKTLEDSLELIRRMHQLGYRKLITTPHIQQEYFKNTPGIINEGLERVREAVRKENIPVELEAAAEYLIDDGFEEKASGKKLLSFGEGYVLVELSYFNPHPNLKTYIFNLQIDGFKVILAHPDRYTYWFNDFEKFEDLKDRGVFFQLNLVSLAGFYPDPVKKFAEKLIDKGMVEFIGSDMHNLRYLEALEKSLDEKALRKLIDSGKLMNREL